MLPRFRIAEALKQAGRNTPSAAVPSEASKPLFFESQEHRLARRSSAPRFQRILRGQAFTSRRSRRPPLLEAFPAKHWTSLRRSEGHRSLFAALRAHSSGLGSRRTVMSSARVGGSENRHSLRLAALASLGFVAELLIMEKQLLAGRKDKIRAAVNALQHLVLEFH
jgi:hypothetical protein